VSRVLERPAVRPPRAWAFPVPEESWLPNGLRLLLVDLPGQHVLSLRLSLPLPVSTEAPGTEGSTLLMARALDEGTAARTSEEIAELAERHGIAWGAGAGERGVHLGLEVTSRHLATAAELMAECLADASFPEAEVARLVRHRLVDIAHDEADPGSRAALEFARTYYDHRDRPHLPVGGTRGSIAAVTRELLRDRHRLLGPAGGAVVLAGDLSTIPDPEALLTATLGAWAGSGRAGERPGQARRAADAGRVVLVPRPGLAQTEVYLGRPGPDRRTPHGWGTFQTLGMLLGGSPHARIDRVLREERGYTYGMRAGFRPRASGGVTVVGGSVRADATLDALGELLPILDVPGSELTGREVREAADFLARTAPGRYGTADAVADELVALVSDGLEPDQVTRTIDQLRELTVEQVATAWDEVRSGPAWTLVLVGDPQHVQGVEDLGLGPVAVVD
jgi:zinc protease